MVTESVCEAERAAGIGGDGSDTTIIPCTAVRTREQVDKLSSVTLSSLDIKPVTEILHEVVLNASGSLYLRPKQIDSKSS